MKNTLLLMVLCAGFCAVAAAQPRPLEKSNEPAAPAVTQRVFEVKYQGGVFGFNEKQEGILRIDEANQRVVFFGKDQKELFGIPFNSLLVVSPQKTVGTPTSGKVVSMIPVPGAGLASLIKEKKRYLVLYYNDPDVDAKGVVSFKVDNKTALEAAIQAVGESAKLTRRGDTYYRPRDAKSDI
jgi:hypothetical protein